MVRVSLHPQFSNSQKKSDMPIVTGHWLPGTRISVTLTSKLRYGSRRHSTSAVSYPMPDGDVVSGSSAAEQDPQPQKHARSDRRRRVKVKKRVQNNTCNTGGRSGGGTHKDYIAHDWSSMLRKHANVTVRVSHARLQITI